MKRIYQKRQILKESAVEQNLGLISALSGLES
jgi:hypothetical protein